MKGTEYLVFSGYEVLSQAAVSESGKPFVGAYRTFTHKCAQYPLQPDMISGRGGAHDNWLVERADHQGLPPRFEQGIVKSHRSL